MPLALAARPRGPLRTLLTEAAAVTVLNEPAQEIYQSALRRDVRVLPNFVDDAPAAPPGTSPRGWAYVGRFTPEKGVVRLIDSWPSGELLDVVGTGPELGAVQAAAAERDGVTVLDPMGRPELRRRLGRYEGLVLPSLWAEGLPTVVLEAMAEGTPTVSSTSVAASTSLQRLGVAEAYDPAAGPADLARVLAVVRGRGATMRARARTVHSTTYSQAAWIAAISVVYDDVARMT